jgi:NitT/TauT family transport system substrate-binding protein
MNKFLIITLLLSLSLIGRAQRIVFTPQWTPQAQFAGYYVAFDKGFYKEAGVDVDMQHPSASYSAFNRLFEGSSDIITQQLVQAMVEIDRGMPLVNILQTSQQNGLMLVSRTDSIRTLDDFRGKKVGVWKVGFGDLVYMMDVDKEMNIQWVPFLEGMNLYISGALDGTLAMSYNEYLQIRVSGHENKPFVRIRDTEYDFPEDGVYVTIDFYRKNKDKVNAFVEASKRGWEYAHEHPEEALDIVMKWVEKEQVHTNRLHQQWMLEEILRLQCKKGQEKPTFELDALTVSKLSDLLLKHRRIHAPINLKKLKGGEL